MLNLLDAEATLKAAERATKEAFAECNRAEAVVHSIPSYRIAHGRALISLDVARSNAEGALEAEKRARGMVWEALNPEAA